MNLEQAILRYVDDHRSASFAELSTRLGSVTPEGHEGFDMDGDYNLCLPGNSNLVLWSGMSELFITTVARLLDERVLRPEPTSHLVYLADGKYLQLPIVKKPPHGGYKKPHWLPCVLRRASKSEVDEWTLAKSIREVVCSTDIDKE